MSRMYKEPKALTAKDLPEFETVMCATCVHRLRGAVAKNRVRCEVEPPAVKLGAHTYDCMLYQPPKSKGKNKDQ